MPTLKISLPWQYFLTNRALSYHINSFYEYIIFFHEYIIFFQVYVLASTEVQPSSHYRSTCQFSRNHHLGKYSITIRAYSLITKTVSVNSLISSMYICLPLLIQMLHTHFFHVYICLPLLIQMLYIISDTSDLRKERTAPLQNNTIHMTDKHIVFEGKIFDILGRNTWASTSICVNLSPDKQAPDAIKTRFIIEELLTEKWIWKP